MQLPIIYTASTEKLLIGVGLFVLFSGLIGWITLCTYYDIDGNTLSVHCGPFSWTIAISDIEKISPSRSLMSGPALSFNRLEIRYEGGKKLLISPKNQADFLNAIGR